MRTRFLSPLGSAMKKIAVTFLFRDDFTTNESAPLTSPRTAEPGPGESTITDTDSKVSISSSELVIATPATQSWNAQRLLSNSQVTRNAGISITTKIKVGTTNNFSAVGFWVTLVSPNTSESALLFGPLGAIFLKNQTLLDSYSLDIFYTIFSILRSAGVFVIRDNVLLWVGVQDSTAMLSVIANSFSAPVVFDNLRVSQLPAPWDTDYGIATERLAGARSAGDTFTHEADCLIEFELDAITQSGLVLDFRFRIQDSSNYWTIRIDETAKYKLVEVVSGVSTSRTNTGTGGVSNGDRIVIICDDEVIRGYAANVLKWTYSNAVNFKTETSGLLFGEGTFGSVSDIISWPRTLSGEAKDALDAVADA